MAWSLAFLNALEHEALDKISLFANDGEKNTHYLVAESFTFSDQEVRSLQKHQLSGTLTTHLKALIGNRDDSFIKNLVQGNESKIVEFINRNPMFSENNVAFQIYPNKNNNRVLVIYNTRRMVDFVQKRQLNPNASGEEGLLHKPEALAFHVDPYTKDPRMTRLQD